jgi:hypothetical protein
LLIDDHSLLIHWHAHGSGARRVKSGMRARVPRVFDPNRIPNIEQKMKHKVNAALGAGNDEHLLRVAAGAARADLLGDRFAQPE